jgi:hypothetical protein
MKTALLGLAAPAAAIAAFALSAAPAAAQQFTSGGFHSVGFTASNTGGMFPAVPRNQGWGLRGRSGFGVRSHDGRHDRDGDRRRHRRDRFDGGILLGGFDGGDWAYYNNRSWDQDSYNDWWHDNPERAYPAWMRHNEHCDRMWYRGDTLVC